MLAYSHHEEPSRDLRDPFPVIFAHYSHSNIAIAAEELVPWVYGYPKPTDEMPYITRYGWTRICRDARWKCSPIGIKIRMR